MPMRLDGAIGADPHAEAFAAPFEQMKELVVRARRRKQQLSISPSIEHVVHAIWFKNPGLSWHIGPQRVGDLTLKMAHQQPRCRKPGRRSPAGTETRRDGGRSEE